MSVYLFYTPIIQHLINSWPSTYKKPYAPSPYKLPYGLFPACGDPVHGPNCVMETWLKIQCFVNIPMNLCNFSIGNAQGWG